MLRLDGSTLEGGGQLVRNVLALSAMTGLPVTINNVRGKKARPEGFKEFAYCRYTIPRRTEVAIATPSSDIGHPVRIQYNIQLTTPGSIFLIFQALYLYLLYAGASLHCMDGRVSEPLSRKVIKLNITGGTNVSSAPSYDYVSQVLIPNFVNLGLPLLSVKLNRRGWSSGAVQIGSVSFEIEPLAAPSSKEVELRRSSCRSQGQVVEDSGSRTKTHSEIPPAVHPRFPRIDLENLDPGFITEVDITILAPDTTLQPAVESNHSKGGHKRGKNKNQRRESGNHFRKRHTTEPALPKTTLGVEESGFLEPTVPANEDFGQDSSFQPTIRQFLECAAAKSVTRALKSPSPKPRTKGQTSTPEIPLVKIHTTEPTHDASHIYILLVAHTSTGFRLGRGMLYSEYKSGAKNKRHYTANPEKGMIALLRSMIDEKGTKGCLDTFMRDQVVVFEALGRLDEEVREKKLSNQIEEDSESLHTLTAMWVCEQVLGGNPYSFASHLFDVLPDSRCRSTDLPEILVLSLQEVAPIAYAFLGGSFLNPYFDAFRRAVNIAAGEECYANIVTKNAGMVAIMVFVRQDVAGKIARIETADVGVGVQEAGNKGAAGARIGYYINEDTVDLTFVAAHLAPDEWAVERRNEDWKSISERLVFSRTNNSGENTRIRDGETEEVAPLLRPESPDVKKDNGLYSPRSYIFAAGDLNYRTSLTRPGPKDYKKFPQPTEDLNSPYHYSHLLEKDQLTRELQEQKTLQNFSEAPIKFLPTYKFTLQADQVYPEGPTGKWSWAKQRWPSWCDRILYSDFPSSSSTGENNIEVNGYDALPLFQTSDHRAVALSVSVPLKPPSPPAVFLPPFEIDANWKRKRAAARRKEIAVGVAAYLTLTWEGNGLLASIGLVLIGSFFAWQSFLAG
ncbi:hypothetical protein PABG_11088 [Paracoccidioides brasiliensis Pb03]|nr:hypothetical protein PABG_11088 [Paracoccidioides brasiliensis Pb03]